VVATTRVEMKRYVDMFMLKTIANQWTLGAASAQNPYIKTDEIPRISGTIIAGSYQRSIDI
jgi:hypothetical protein